MVSLLHRMLFGIRHISTTEYEVNDSCEPRLEESKPKSIMKQSSKWSEQAGSIFSICTDSYVPNWIMNINDRYS